MDGRSAVTLLWIVAILVLDAVPAAAINLRFEPTLLGQVRDGNGYFPGPTEAPTEIYGDFGLSGLRHGTTLDTYFRLQDNFADANETETDFFSGVMRIPSAPGGLDIQLGRQIVAESPVGVWDADSGQVRVAVAETPLSFTVFGGAPRYWEPTFSSPSISQDEQIFGGSVRMAEYTGGALALGYLQQNRQGEELMQQITLTGTRTFDKLPGLPSLYGNFALDADHANIDQVRAGVQSFVGQPNLLLNFESGYYKPQDGGDIVQPNLNRRENSIFQLFSVSELLQFRGGVRYNFSPTVSAYADLSYQRYEQLKSSYVNGYVWSGGLLYLPGGDGLEVARVEYYGIDGAGGSVNGANLSYENRVYENVLFRANCNVGYYDKATNQSGTAVASLIGVGYMFLPGLVGELDFEANRNQLYPEDFRFGFFISYSADYGTSGGLHRDNVGNQGRPWPWAPKEFGPASWGPGKGNWSANPSLPSNGWAASTFASAAASREAAKAAQAAETSGDGGAGEGAKP